jgi:hypothetical protein
MSLDNVQYRTMTKICKETIIQEIAYMYNEECNTFVNEVSSYVEGPEKATRGGVNGSQSKFLTGIWPMSLTQPDVPLY